MKIEMQVRLRGDIGEKVKNLRGGGAECVGDLW